MIIDHGERVWIRGGRSSSKHGGDDDGAIKHGGDEVDEGGGSKQDAGKHGGDRGERKRWLQINCPSVPQRPLRCIPIRAKSKNS